MTSISLCTLCVQLCTTLAQDGITVAMQSMLLKEGSSDGGDPTWGTNAAAEFRRQQPDRCVEGGKSSSPSKGGMWSERWQKPATWVFRRYLGATLWMMGASHLPSTQPGEDPIVSGFILRAYL